MMYRGGELSSGGAVWCTAAVSSAQVVRCSRAGVGCVLDGGLVGAPCGQCGVLARPCAVCGFISPDADAQVKVATD